MTRAQLLVAGEDGLVLGDVVADLAEFVEDLVDGELGEAVELQFEDGVDLPVAEDQRRRLVENVMSMPYFAGSSLTPSSSVPRRLIACRRSSGRGFRGRRRAMPDCADDPDDVVEMVERDLVADQDVLALAGLAQQEGGAAAHDVDAVIDEGADGAGRAGAPCGWPLSTARKIMEKLSCIWVCL